MSSSIISSHTSLTNPSVTSPSTISGPSTSSPSSISSYTSPTANGAPGLQPPRVTTPVHTPVRPADRPSDASSSNTGSYRSPFPQSRGRKLQHKFLGIDWKFIQPPLEFNQISSSMLAPDVSKFDASQTLFSVKSPRPDNGLLPEEPDVADLILDRIAHEMLDEEYESVKKYGQNPTTLKKRKGTIMKIMSVFQDGADDRFVRRLQKKQAELAEKEKMERSEAAEQAEELRKQSELGQAASTNSTGRYMKRKLSTGEELELEKEMDSEMRENGMVSLETTIKRTKQVVERVGKALKIGDKKDQDDSDDGALGDLLRDDEHNVEPSLVRDVEQSFEHAADNRPPSPIVFARTLTRFKIAENLPAELLEKRERRSTNERNERMTRDKLYDAAAEARMNVMKEIEEAMLRHEENDDSEQAKNENETRKNKKISFKDTSVVGGSSRSSTRGRQKSNSPRKSNSPQISAMARKGNAMQLTAAKIDLVPIHARRSSGAELQKLYFDGMLEEKTQYELLEQPESDKDRRLVEEKEKKRYGAWYIKPEKWSVGMGKVMSEMAAKQQGSWGVEMEAIKDKSEALQTEIPKLFIGKVFKQQLMKKGRRVPHFLTNVEVGDDDNVIAEIEKLTKAQEALKR